MTLTLCGSDVSLREAAERSLREGSGRLVLTTTKRPPKPTQRWGGEWLIRGFGRVWVKGTGHECWIIDCDAKDVLRWLDGPA